MMLPDRIAASNVQQQPAVNFAWSCHIGPLIEIWTACLKAVALAELYDDVLVRTCGDVRLILQRDRILRNGGEESRWRSCKRKTGGAGMNRFK